MKKNDTFTDRRREADKSKSQRLAKFKASLEQASPETVQRATRRQEQSSAQAEHNAALAVKNKIEAERLKTEADAAALLRRADEDAAEQIRVTQELQEKKAAEAAKALDEASQKAKRDARYSNRKARR